MSSEGPPLRTFGARPDAVAVVWASAGATGAHVGVWYLRDEDDAGRVLHLAWHYELREDDFPPDGAVWIASTLDENAANDLHASAVLIGRHREGRVPYALANAGAKFAVDGTLDLNRSLGMTCAEFVLLVFEHAGIELISRRTWENLSAVRVEEDARAQEKLVSILRKGTAEARLQATRIEHQVGACTRIRAEEVAASSGLAPQPVEFSRAELAGRAILARVSAEHAEPAQPSP